MLNFLRSTILSKYIVAITGILMVLFIIGHTLGNLQVFLGAEALNQYAVDLRKLGPLLWIARITLIVAVFLHIIATINLNKRNKKVAGDYKKRSYKKTTFAGKAMVYAGIMIFFFIVYHLLHFTFGATHPEHYQMVDEMGRHDVYGMVILGFKEPLVSIFYIIAVIFLGLHLKHGTHSVFQTLGISGDSFKSKMQALATAFAIFIVVALCSIPIAILAGFIGGNIS